jgi:PKD repeat protein
MYKLYLYPQLNNFFSMYFIKNRVTWWWKLFNWRYKYSLYMYYIENKLFNWRYKYSLYMYYIENKLFNWRYKYSLYMYYIENKLFNWGYKYSLYMYYIENNMYKLYLYLQLNNFHHHVTRFFMKWIQYFIIPCISI